MHNVGGGARLNGNGARKKGFPAGRSHLSWVAECWPLVAPKPSNAREGRIRAPRIGVFAPGLVACATLNSGLPACFSHSFF